MALSPNMKKPIPMSKLNTLNKTSKIIEPDYNQPSRATKDQQEYTIGSRSLKRIAIAELIKFREYYQAKVNAEENKAAGRSSRLVARL